MLKFLKLPLDKRRDIKIGSMALNEQCLFPKGYHAVTIEQQESLTRELEGAMQSGDDKRIRCAQSNILLAVMDCQRKTSERVKRLSWKFSLSMVVIGTVCGFATGKWEIIKVLLGL